MLHKYKQIRHDGYCLFLAKIPPSAIRFLMSLKIICPFANKIHLTQIKLSPVSNKMRKSAYHKLLPLFPTTYQTPTGESNKESHRRALCRTVNCIVQVHKYTLATFKVSVVQHKQIPFDEAAAHCNPFVMQQPLCIYSFLSKRLHRAATIFCQLLNRQLAFNFTT